LIRPSAAYKAGEWKRLHVPHESLTRTWLRYKRRSERMLGRRKPNRVPTDSWPPGGGSQAVPRKSLDRLKAQGFTSSRTGLEAQSTSGDFGEVCVNAVLERKRYRRQTVHGQEKANSTLYPESQARAVPHYPQRIHALVEIDDGWIARRNQRYAEGSLISSSEVLAVFIITLELVLGAVIDLTDKVARVRAAMIFVGDVAIAGIVELVVAIGDEVVVANLVAQKLVVVAVAGNADIVALIDGVVDGVVDVGAMDVVQHVVELVEVVAEVLVVVVSVLGLALITDVVVVGEVVGRVHPCPSVRHKAHSIASECHGGRAV